MQLIVSITANWLVKSWAKPVKSSTKKLVKQRIGALADAADGLLREIQSDRQATRVEAWWNRLYLGWRQEGARTFYKALRGEDLNPRASFPDPDNNGLHTADPRRIAQLFRRDWEKVFSEGQ